MAAVETKRNEIGVKVLMSTMRLSLLLTPTNSLCLSRDLHRLPLSLHGMFALMFSTAHGFVHQYLSTVQTSECKYKFKVLNYDLRLVCGCAHSYIFISIFECFSVFCFCFAFTVAIYSFCVLYSFEEPSLHYGYWYFNFILHFNFK